MWFIVLGLIGLIYLTINVYLPSGGMFEAYVLRPALWIALAVITFIIARNEDVNFLKFKKIRRWSLGKTPIHAGLLLGGFQVALLIIVGILFGFGKSPYSFAPQTMVINAFYVGSLVVGIEFSRAYLTKKGTTNIKKYSTIILVLATLLYMFLLLSPDKFAVLNFSNPEKALEFAGATLVTALAMNLLASYLSYLGGATAAMGYTGTLLMFEWFSPILPNPHWTILALIGTIAPAIGFVVLQDSIEPFIKKKKPQRYKSETKHGWTLVAVFALILVFFSYGYLGVEPTVIYSGSMRPALDVGDMAIVDKVDVSTIKVGDIIQFVSLDNQSIIHRVKEINESEKGLLFITQGDANKDPDPDPVNEKNILGKVVFNIPEIGWIQIYVKEFFRIITGPLR